MKILLIDTSGATGSIALAETGAGPPVVTGATLAGRTSSERLVPAIRELAEARGIALQSLDAVAVVHGPGSFTGVRVGLSAAKGLCEGLNLPLVAISRLAVLAEMADAPAGTQVHVLLDAGRGEFYCGVYVDGECLREAMLTHAEVLAEFAVSVESVVMDGVNSQPIVVACERAVADSVAPLDPQLIAEPAAADALPLALHCINAGDFDDVAFIDANYLRRTDLEIFAKQRMSGMTQR
jgi:tRNA threonylcarbamoyladenosine biosynthesis protein TsaB